ncbi:oleate hydratase [Cryobacterium sp. TMT3-29-2]|uniref:oleate hydratase n=1 Tax=Cryobacterium sp. TMT3-29-2 TaxID=2555867 RepID=UPI0010749C33|nr:oleate hydratase [Cryobacterium sp. TMT3-29-2]TFC93538.1 oleate hydratase [Cryobacterium sp. TMT3-29-2]
MATAAFAIRDAGVPGENIHILEELGHVGGAMDAVDSPAIRGAMVTRGARMFCEEVYQTTWDLFSTIPSLEDPDVTVREEMLDWNDKHETHGRTRLADARHRVLDATGYGLDTRNRFEISRMLALREKTLGARRIEDLFSEHFLQTNFWHMWRTTFAFQKWNSAAELRRYFLRFIQELENLDTLSGVRRTTYNQNDSMIVPLQRWLVSQGVDVRFGTRVTDVDVTNSPQRRRATRLHVEDSAGSSEIDLGQNDLAFITIGSIVADTTYGGNDTVPPLIRDRVDGSWSLWEKLAKKAPDFGRPNTFCGNIDESKWESFTRTMHSDTLVKRWVEYTGNELGTGAMTTLIESGWYMSAVVVAQPHFANQTEGTYTMWGWGLEIDNEGDYVKKTMAQATGTEILTELMHQFGFEDILDEVLATTDVTTSMMPYASALFARRVPGDRPKVIPDGAQNFAFLGQFTELPGDVVFTVEYSIHGAMRAVYEFLGVDREIPPIFKGLHDPKVLVKALQAAY